MNRQYYIRQKKYGVHKVTERRKVNSLQYDFAHEEVEKHPKVRNIDNVIEERPNSKSQLVPNGRPRESPMINSEAKKVANIIFMKQ